jgi:hypothetical protein
MAVQWIGGASPSATDDAPPAAPSFGDGALWFGRHSVDQDVLVFDPAREDPSASNLRFFSLSRFRVRAFPRGIVEELISEITDESLLADARAQYEKRETLEADYRREQEAVKTAALEQRRVELLSRHREYLSAQDLPYEGVQETGVGEMKQRRSKCPACSIPLDNYAGARCLGCNGVLCSCGACSCVRPARTSE